jgi:hypothetical protein
VAWELSSLEQQIVTVAAVGLEDAEIAVVVGSTGAEVKLVLERVMASLGLASRWELILYFIGIRQPRNRLSRENGITDLLRLKLLPVGTTRATGSGPGIKPISA